MNEKLMRTVACVLAASLALPPEVIAQAAAPPPPPAAPTQSPDQPVFRTEELDQMTAPIALYPDELVAQILMASTYPLEIVQADRWLGDSANAQLKGDQLASALEGQTWDPSVKSLVPFPQVLKMMSDKLDWTQRLGDAFLAQQADVMASIQRLRRKAQDAGSLKSTEQQTVVVEKDTQAVVIQPANPQVIYVPTYNPTVVYGSWPYPSYPPVYYPPPPAYYPGYYPGAALASGLAFGLGVAAIGSLAGWGSCNWGGNNININSNRYNTINRANIQSGRAAALSSNATSWRHDSSHRGGVAYRDAGSRQAFQRQGTRPNAANRDFRGYDGQRGLGQGTSRPPGGAAGRGQGQAGAAAGRQGGAAGARAQAGAAGASAGARAQPSAFQGMGNGAQTRAQADRGRASRQSVQASSPSRSMSGGGARAGGGMRGGGGRR